jgi:hypothetical protein
MSDVTQILEAIRRGAVGTALQTLLSTSTLEPVNYNA